MVVVRSRGGGGRCITGGTGGLVVKKNYCKGNKCSKRCSATRAYRELKRVGARLRGGADIEKNNLFVNSLTNCPKREGGRRSVAPPPCMPMLSEIFIYRT